MKNTIKNLAAGMALIFSLGANAAPKFFSPGASSDFYITNTSGCQIHSDNRAPDKAYVGFYINQRPGEYSPYSDERVYLWVGACSMSDEAIQAAFKGKRIYLQLKASGYSPGHWDLDIANHTSLNLMMASVSPSPSSPIEFIGEPGSGPEHVVVTVIGTLSTSDFVQASTKSRQRLELNLRNMQLTFINSQGVTAFTQNLSSDETYKLKASLQRATESCPVEITASRSLRKVIRVSSKCVDLSQAPVLNNQG